MNHLFFSLINKFKWQFLLLILICSIGLYYGYHKIIILPPESTDIWRQSDCASFALNYYQNGMDFFHPQIHHCINLKNDGCAVGEFPIIYYFVAILYKIFGVHEFLFRLTNLIIFILGILALYEVVLHFTKDKYYSIFIPLLLFASPLIVFYANNFLSDVPSLSFTFLGWNYILKYKDKRKLLFFILSMIFFTLAILLKANAIISFITLGALFFLEYIGWAKFQEQKIFDKRFINAIGFIVSLFIVYSWYKWAIGYNELHESNYFVTKAWPGWPIWEANEQDFVSTITSIFFTLYSILDGYSAAVFLFCIPFILLNRAYLSKFLFGVFLLLLCGTLLFFFYFFVGFRNQSYYYINLMTLPIFTFIAALVILKEKYAEVFVSPIFKLMTMGLLLLNIDHTDTEINGAYYNGGWRDAKLNSVFFESEFKKYFDKIVKEKTDIIISFPDTTPNASLYVLNRRGYSNYGFPNDKIDSTLVLNLINQGANYLVLANDELPNDPILKKFILQEIGTYKNVHIYSLNKQKK